MIDKNKIISFLQLLFIINLFQASCFTMNINSETNSAEQFQESYSQVSSTENIESTITGSEGEQEETESNKNNNPELTRKRAFSSNNQDVDKNINKKKRPNTQPKNSEVSSQQELSLEELKELDNQGIEQLDRIFANFHETQARLLEFLNKVLKKHLVISRTLFSQEAFELSEEQKENLSKTIKRAEYYKDAGNDLNTQIDLFRESLDENYDYFKKEGLIGQIFQGIKFWEKEEVVQNRKHQTLEEKRQRRDSLEEEANELIKRITKLILLAEKDILIALVSNDGHEVVFKTPALLLSRLVSKIYNGMNVTELYNKRNVSEEDLNSELFEVELPLNQNELTETSLLLKKLSKALIFSEASRGEQYNYDAALFGFVLLDEYSIHGNHMIELEAKKRLKNLAKLNILIGAPSELQNFLIRKFAMTCVLKSQEERSLNKLNEEIILSDEDENEHLPIVEVNEEINNDENLFRECKRALKLELLARTVNRNI